MWDERSPLAREGEAGARCGMNASAGRQRLRPGFMLWLRKAPVDKLRRGLPLS